MESLLEKIEMCEYTQKLYSEGNASKEEVFTTLKEVIEQLSVCAKELQIQDTGEYKDIPQDKIESLKKLNIRAKVLKENAIEIGENNLDD